MGLPREGKGGDDEEAAFFHGTWPSSKKKFVTSHRQGPRRHHHKRGPRLYIYAAGKSNNLATNKLRSFMGGLKRCTHEFGQQWALIHTERRRDS